MNSFVRILEAEINQLERKLEADPTYIKLREAKRLLALYVGDMRISSEEVESQVSVAHPPSRQPTGAASMTAVEAVRQVLMEEKRPVPTLELLDRIRHLGVTFGGKTPQNSLSSILSKAEEFEPRGRAGWVLVEAAAQSESAGVAATIDYNGTTEFSEVDTTLPGTESTSEIDDLL